MTPAPPSFRAGRLWRGLAVAGCVALVAATPGWSKASTGEQQQERSEELREVRLKLDSLLREIASGEDIKNEAADALRASERAVSDANRRLYELAQKLREVREALEASRRESQTLRERIATHQVKVGQLLARQHIGSQREPMRLLLSGQDPNQTVRLWTYYRIVNEARLNAIKNLAADVARRDLLIAEQASRQAELDRIAEEQAAERNQLEREKAERERVYADAAAKITAQRREVARLQQDEKRLTRLVEELTRMSKPSKKPPAEAPPSVGKKLTNGKAAEEPPSGQFAELKGKLRKPVAGELVHRFGSNREQGGVTWRGLFFRAPTGTEVRAVATGKIVFADWLRGFGNIIIIDHGDGMMSLYGNNETLYKTLNTTVALGEVIAAAGDSGGNAESGLYFELRYKGKAFDPEPWLAK